MSSLPSTLEFQIHRSDGEVSKFIAEGTAAVQNILEQIQRGKVFAQPSIRIPIHNRKIWMGYVQV